MEGLIEGITGWSIDGRTREKNELADRTADASSLYDKLENDVLPVFYEYRDHFIGIMRHALALNGSFFNTQRMLQQCVLSAYFR